MANFPLSLSLETSLNIGWQSIADTGIYDMVVAESSGGAAAQALRALRRAAQLHTERRGTATAKPGKIVQSAPRAIRGRGTGAAQTDVASQQSQFSQPTQPASQLPLSQSETVPGWEQFGSQREAWASMSTQTPSHFPPSSTDASQRGSQANPNTCHAVLLSQLQRVLGFLAQSFESEEIVAMSLASPRFQVSRLRSRRWAGEVMSIGKDGRDCPASCQWVFKSASRVTPTYFAVGAAGVGAASACLSRHGASLWSKTTCSDAEKRPAWQHPPPAVPTMRERWNEKSPAREKGPSFWRSHGNGQGRYASTRGATAEDHLAQSGTPRASFAEASSAPVPSSTLSETLQDQCGFSQRLPWRSLETATTKPAIDSNSWRAQKQTGERASCLQAVGLAAQSQPLWFSQPVGAPMTNASQPKWHPLSQPKQPTEQVCPASLSQPLWAHSQPEATQCSWSGSQGHAEFLAASGSRAIAMAPETVASMSQAGVYPSRVRSQGRASVNDFPPQAQPNGVAEAAAALAAALAPLAAAPVQAGEERKRRRYRHKAPPPQECTPISTRSGTGMPQSPLCSASTGRKRDFGLSHAEVLAETATAAIGLSLERLSEEALTLRKRLLASAVGPPFRTSAKLVRKGQLGVLHASKPHRRLYICWTSTGLPAVRAVMHWLVQSRQQMQLWLQLQLWNDYMPQMFRTGFRLALCHLSRFKCSVVHVVASADRGHFESGAPLFFRRQLVHSCFSV
eukprot:s1769_g11.t2